MCIEAGAKVKVQTIGCARLRVAGDLEISGDLEATEIILAGGSTFSGRLHNPEAKLHLEAGARIQAESASFAEMIVEGEIDIPGAVFADRITVMSTGRMNVGRLSAASIEVAPGGLLQGLIEKYVPRPSPAESIDLPDDDAEAEAA